MEKRENQRVMLTRRLIQESLTRLLARESIHKVSIRSLCEEAGVNRSTFYKYYGSQYDVLAEMEAEMIGRVREALEDGDSSSEAIGRKMEAICSYFEQNMAAIRVLVGNNVDPDFPEKLFSLPQIRGYIMEGLGDRYSGEQKEYVYVFLINGCYRLVREWIATEGRCSFREVARLLQELIDRVRAAGSPAQ